MRLQYRLVNVFTRDNAKLSGNPLCVFEDGSALTTEQMQALALQFNLSETTFILPSQRATARVRIFTPTFEMPFAGHPTLGTAQVVRSLSNVDALSLEMQAGIIPVKASGNAWELTANHATTRAPHASRSEIAAALGLDESEIKAQPLYVNSGSEQLIVPLITGKAVERVQIQFDLLCDVTRDGPRPMAYVFAPHNPQTIYARFFFAKGCSVCEDPATGSAAANLGGWFLAQNTTLPLHLAIYQGDQVGRPSTLNLRIDSSRQVHVAGEVIEVGRGYIEM
jgi:trans-2,3-dihydro-3-hydroxyanthranilate isomerase